MVDDVVRQPHVGPVGVFRSVLLGRCCSGDYGLPPKDLDTVSHDQLVRVGSWRRG